MVLQGGLNHFYEMSLAGDVPSVCLVVAHVVDKVANYHEFLDVLNLVGLEVSSDQLEDRTPIPRAADRLKPQNHVDDLLVAHRQIGQNPVCFEPQVPVLRLWVAYAQNLCANIDQASLGHHLVLRVELINAERLAQFGYQGQLVPRAQFGSFGQSAKVKHNFIDLANQSQAQLTVESKVGMLGAIS